MPKTNTVSRIWMGNTSISGLMYYVFRISHRFLYFTYLNCLSFRFSITWPTETWMRDDITMVSWQMGPTCHAYSRQIGPFWQDTLKFSDRYSIKGYDLFEKHRSTKPDGGAGLYIAEKNGICQKQRPVLFYIEDCIECVSIEIDRLVFSTNRNVVVSVIYRPPNTGVVLECISSAKKRCYLNVDYNINVLNYDNHSATAEFVDMLFSHAFLSLINCPSRITQNSATIIDTIFTNDIGEWECIQNGIIVTDIYIGHNTQVMESDETYRISRNYSNVSKLSFQQALSEIDWLKYAWYLTPSQPLLEIYKTVWEIPSKKRKIKC